MHRKRRSARINVKVLIILVAVLATLVVTAFAARHVRRRILTARSLTVGKAAFDAEDWPAACKHLKQYLSRNSDDVDMLKKFGEASLSVRPMESQHIRGATWAYRNVIRLSPTEALPYEKLAILYTGSRDWGELAYIARRRMEHIPNDLKAPVWLGQALLLLRKPEDANEVLLDFVKKLELLSEKHSEYVQACALLSEIAARPESAGASEKALEWLTRAVDYDPSSVEALARRARSLRTTAVPGRTDAEMQAAARADLVRADEIGTSNPRLRLFLCGEWLAHDQLKLAANELDAVKNLDQATLKVHFFDPSDWVVARFLQAAELALRRQATAEGVALADETLGVLKAERRRILVLPQSVRLYLRGADRVADARRCLDEYLRARHSQKAQFAAGHGAAYLQALVARAEDMPYRVIDVLEPATVGDPREPQLWQLLAEAYSRTDQTRRAVPALIKYLLVRPRDPKMTLQLAKEYLKLRDWNRAFETARLAEPLDPTDIVIKLLRIEASVYVAVESRYKMDEARLDVLEKELAALRQKHPKRVDLRILQAIIAVYREHPADAEKELKLAIKECDEPLPAEMQLTRHYFRTKRRPEALKVCQTACGRHPKVAEPWLALAGLHVAGGDYEQAISVLDSALEKEVEGRWEQRAVTIRLALVEALHGDRGKAIGLLKALAAKDSQEVRARSLLLSLREVGQDRAAAAKLIEEVRKAQGESGLLWRLYQASLWLSGEDWRSRQQEITDALQRCIHSDPEWSAPVLLLVEMHQRLGNYARVEEVCRQALSRNPSATDVADRLVTLLARQGRFADAQKVLKSVETNPRVRSAWNIGLALRRGDFAGAIDELKLRASNDDRDANSRILLARLIYWQTGNADEAFKYLREAEAVDPDAMALIAAKVMILKAEKREDEASAILTAQVSKIAQVRETAQVSEHKSLDRKRFGAYLMRAAYLMSIEELDKAEKDYIKLSTFEDEEGARGRKLGARGHEVLARFYTATDRRDQAIATLRKAVKAYPEDLRLERALMFGLFGRKAKDDAQRATEILASLEKKLPNDPDLMRIRAILLVQEGTPELTAKARQMLERAVSLERTSVAAHLALIDITMRQGDFEDARDNAIRGLGSNRESIPLMLARAKAEIALNNAPMAFELAQMALAKAPDNAEAWEMLTSAALSSNDQNLIKQAQSLTAEAIAKKPTDEQLQLAQARILAALGDNKTAISNLEAYCQTKEGSASVPAILTLGEFYRAGGDIAKSGQKLDQAAKLAPDSPAVVRARARWLGTQKKFSEVLKVLAQYRAKGGEDPETLAVVAAVLVSSTSKGDRQEAVRIYEDLVKAMPTSLDARLGRASAIYAMGDADLAKQEYRDVLKQDPASVRALNDLAWILAEHDRDYKAALELADKGLRLAPNDHYLIDTRGVILSNLPGRLKDARSDFEKLVSVSPADSSAQAKALLQLGRVCAKLKDQEAATRHLEKALQIDRQKSVFDPKERSELQDLIQRGKVESVAASSDSAAR